MSTIDLPESTEHTEPKTSNVFNITFILSVVAIVLAIASFGFDIINFSALFKNRNQVQLLAQTTALATQQQSLTIKELQNSTMQTTVKSAYIISAVKYLVYLATIELNIRHNAIAALHTLTEAQQALGDSHPNINLALTHDIHALQAIPEIHTHQIFSDLAVVSNQIEKISIIPSEKPMTMKKTMEAIQSSVDDTHKNWREKLWESISQVKNLFVIRHLDQPNTPVLDMQLSMAAKQNMISQINMAQWALLHHDPTVYQAALKAASQWLTQYFSLSSSTAPLMTKIDALSKINIAPPLPSLNATVDAIANMNAPVTKNIEPKKATASSTQTTPTQREI